MELAKTVKSYITCEGRKDVVRLRHLKLLSVLKQKCSVNLPALLNSLLHDAARSLKNAQHVESVVSHHGLIRLIVSHSLTQQQSSWEELIAIIKGGLAAPSPKPKHVAPKRKRSSMTPERPEKHRESVAEKHVASTPKQPERPRKSTRLARIRGRLEKIQESTSQLIEITDELLEPEGRPSEEKAEKSAGEAEQPREGIEEGDEHSETEVEAEHSQEATQQSDQEEEMEQLEGSPPRDPLAEDELAAVLVNMEKYYQPSSPADLPNEPLEENAPEKSHAEEENLPVHDDEIG